MHLYAAVDCLDGDVGIALDLPGVDSLRVYFLAPGGEVRSFSPYTLPPHETVFAMTVHKSQGSEFETVLLALPEGGDSSNVTRELIYTALTRAKKKLILRGSEETFRRGILTPTLRNSGLAALLWP